MSSGSFSQDTSLIKYLPLKVGNVWVYTGEGWGGGLCGYMSWVERYKITSTSKINGKTYFVFSHTVISQTCSRVSRLFENNLPIRIDSLNLNIYKSASCGSSNQLLVDSLKSLRNDSSRTCYAQSNWSICTDTSAYNIFGTNRPSKLFSTQGPEWSSQQRYTKNIGLVSFNYFWGESYNINLTGAVIDGILYGDTAMPLEINKLSSEIPEKFSLYQNYPNPFNPVTIIKLQIADYRLTTLKIFDALGKEVATLVNESLKPGTYEVEWNGDNFPSGVYFAKLETENYIETRKLILMK